MEGNAAQPEPEATAQPTDSGQEAAPAAADHIEPTPDAPAAPDGPAPESVEDSAAQDRGVDTPKPSRSERQRLREQEAAAKAKAEADTQAESSRLQEQIKALLQKEREDAAREAERTRLVEEQRQRFTQWLGDDEQYKAAQLKLRQRPPVLDDITREEWDRYRSDLSSAQDLIDRWDANRNMLGAVQEEAERSASVQVHSRFVNEMATAASFEGVDRAKFLSSPDIPTALKTLYESVKQSRDAFWKQRVEDLEGDLELAKEAQKAAEARAFGTMPSPDLGLGGATGGGMMSWERFKNLPLEERMKFKRDQTDLYNRMVNEMMQAA